MPKPREESRKHRRKPALDFSFAGVLYIAMMLFMGLAAVNAQNNLLFAVFGLMVGILIVSGILSRLVLRKLDVQRRMPEHAVVGRRATLLYDFANRKRYWPSVSVCASELDGGDAFTRSPQPYMLHAAAGMTAIVPVEVIPRRRGLQKLDRYQLGTSFPFGFIKRAADRKNVDTLLVYPALGTVDRRLLQKCLSAEFANSRLRPRSGGSDEFYGVREFRSGDSPRSINWRRSARTGTLVANEMTQVAPPRLMICVDTYRSEGSIDGQSAVERCIAMAASLAEHALETNLMVGVHAWTGSWTTINPSRGKRHRRNLLSELAQLPPNADQPLDALIESIHTLQRPGLSIVLFTPRKLDEAGVDARLAQCVVISADSDEARRWFSFEEAVDFDACAPLDGERTTASERR